MIVIHATGDYVKADLFYSVWGYKTVQPRFKINKAHFSIRNLERLSFNMHEY